MKNRLDIMLVERGLVSSREKAKAVIMAGNVYVNDQKEDKAGTFFSDDVRIDLRCEAPRYVSRGGLKLEKAINDFNVNVEDLICTDVGSSTGGFTDCMLQNGAKKVYAIDVGYGQLDWSLRNDHRVICMEKTNIRYVKPEDLADPIDFSSIDVSFISLTKVLPNVYDYLKYDGRVICLIKPQFEAGREKVGKKGVVREKETHIEVINRVYEFAVALGFKFIDLTWSPVKGPEGNIEYLMYLIKNDELENNPFDVNSIVNGAFEELNNNR